MYKKRLKTREQVIIRISRHRYLQHFLLISWWDAFVYIIKFDRLFFRWIWDCWIRSAMLWHNLKHFENGQYSVREGLDCRGYVTLVGHVMKETFFNTKVNFVHFIQIFYQYIGYCIYIYICDHCSSPIKWSSSQISYLKDDRGFVSIVKLSPPSYLIAIIQ